MSTLFEIVNGVTTVPPGTVTAQLRSPIFNNNNYKTIICSIKTVTLAPSNQVNMTLLSQNFVLGQYLSGSGAVTITNDILVHVFSTLPNPTLSIGEYDRTLWGIDPQSKNSDEFGFALGAPSYTVVNNSINFIPPTFFLSFLSGAAGSIVSMNVNAY